MTSEPRPGPRTRVWLLAAVIGPLSSACALVATFPPAHTPVYLWSARLSNVASHPTAPLYVPERGYAVPVVEVSFPDLPRSLPYRFLIDTGAPSSLVTRELATALELRARPRWLFGRRTGGLEWTRLSRVNIGQIELRQVPVEVVDTLPPVGSPQSPVTIDGVWGMNVWSRIALEMRPDEGRLLLHPTGSPLPGTIIELGTDPARVVIAGGVGVPAASPLPPPAATAPTAEASEDMDWAPILARQEEAVVPPPTAAMAPPPGERDPRLPPGGPHLLVVATGRETSRIHPELLPWAGEDGVVATVAAPVASSLLDTLLAEVLDERPHGDALEEVVRYRLPSLDMGPSTLTDLSFDHRDEAWAWPPMAAVVGADVLSHYRVGLDAAAHRLTLKPVEGGPAGLSIQSQLLAWAEATLAPTQTHYPTIEEGMRRFLYAGRWPEAAQLAGRMIQQNPSDVAAWLVLARHAERRGDLEEAIQFYRRLYWVRSGQVPAVLGAARIGLLTGDLEEALQDLATADTTLDLDKKRLARARGLVELARGRVEPAAAAFTRALDYGEDAPSRRALAWLAWRERRFELAREHLDHLFLATPDDPFAQDLMVAVLRALGREADVEGWVEQLARRFPWPPPDGRDPLGPLRVRLARERGDTTTVRRVLFAQDQAYALAADATPAPRLRARALETRARLYLAALEQLPLALDLAAQANQADPSGRAGLLVGADVLRAMGDDEAPAAYRRAWAALPYDLGAFVNSRGEFIPQLTPDPPRAPPNSRGKPPRRLPSKPKR